MICVFCCHRHRPACSGWGTPRRDAWRRTAPRRCPTWCARTPWSRHDSSGSATRTSCSWCRTDPSLASLPECFTDSSSPVEVHLSLILGGAAASNLNLDLWSYFERIRSINKKGFVYGGEHFLYQLLDLIACDRLLVLIQRKLADFTWEWSQCIIFLQ